MMQWQMFDEDSVRSSHCLPKDGSLCQVSMLKLYRLEALYFSSSKAARL
jgi:hypothetical protein